MLLTRQTWCGKIGTNRQIVNLRVMHTVYKVPTLRLYLLGKTGNNNCAVSSKYYKPCDSRKRLYENE